MAQFTVAAVQFAPLFGALRHNLEQIAALVRGIAADVVVLPELCTTGYDFRDRAEVAALAESAQGTTAKFLQDLAVQNGTWVVAGFAEKAGPRLFNAALLAPPDGSPVRIYRKTHLFYREKLLFDPGDSGFFVVEDHKRDLRLGPMVCYDWRFPESARVLALKGADLIVCPANLVTEAWRAVMPARAIENKVCLAVANRTGMEDRAGQVLRFKGCSVIYDAEGGVLAQAGPGEAAVISAVIDPAASRDKSFDALNDVFRDRRPEQYAELVRR